MQCLVGKYGSEGKCVVGKYEPRCYLLDMIKEAPRWTVTQFAYLVPLS